MLMDYFENFVSHYDPYKGGPWCYEDGLIYRGLELLHQTTRDQRWLGHLERLIQRQLLDGPSLADYEANDYNIDNILPGRALLYLHSIDNDRRWMEYADLLIEQLRTHPRTHSGVYWHKLRYPWQIWLDGLYMGQPFQISYGLRTQNDRLVEDSLQQLMTALDETFVSETGLYAHAYDEARKQPWADKASGFPAAHWARAVGWLAMAMVEVAELVGPVRFAPLADRTTNLLKQVERWQQPSGLWLQVMDQPDFPGNWEETSASAMFTYALLRARDLGLWSGETEGRLNTLISNSVKPKEAGGHEMVEMCHVAGLGWYENRFRDGSAEYYISETRVCDDAKGVGPLMSAVAADMMLRAKHRTTAAE